MKINILEKNIELDNKKVDYINSKMNSLKKIIKDSSEEDSCDFRIGKNSGSHKKGKIFFAEATIKTTHKNYGARAESETLTEAVDLLKDELSKKIRRYKGKRMSLKKRGGRLLKKMLRK